MCYINLSKFITNNYENIYRIISRNRKLLDNRNMVFPIIYFMNKKNDIKKISQIFCYRILI